MAFGAKALRMGGKSLRIQGNPSALGLLEPLAWATASHWKRSLPRVRACFDFRGSGRRFRVSDSPKRQTESHMHECCTLIGNVDGFDRIRREPLL